MAKPKIGERDEAWLAKFVDRAIANQIGANLPPSLTGEEIQATTLLKVDNDIELSQSAIDKLKSLLGIP